MVSRNVATTYNTTAQKAQSFLLNYTIALQLPTLLPSEKANNLGFPLSHLDQRFLPMETTVRDFEFG